MKTATMKNCGCEILFDDLLKINDTFKCPNHPKNGIHNVAAYCSGGCGKTVIRTNGPYLVIKCSECIALEKKDRDKAYKKANSHKRKIYDANKHKAKSKKVVINPNFDLSLYARGLSMYLPGGKSI